MENNKTIDIFKMAILMEKRGQAFYSEIAAKSDNIGVKNIFATMAEEEVIHAEYLSMQLKNYLKTGGFIAADLPSNDEDSAATLILSDEMKQQIAGAGFEAAAISAAMDMESKAIKFYSESAEAAETPDEQKLFRWLAEWEKGHHKILHELDSDLKERIWNDNHFWPF